MPGRRAAHAAHDKIDLHTGLAGADRVSSMTALIDETVHFRNDPRGFTGTGLFGFSSNQSDKVFPQADRRQRQMMKFLWPGIARQQVKKLGEILAKAFSTSKESDIAIDSARADVVVAGGEVAITPNAVGFLPDYEADFAMGLIADQSIDHVSAYFFERSGPGDIRLLIEAGLKLDQDRYLFAGFGRAQQRLDDR